MKSKLFNKFLALMLCLLMALPFIALNSGKVIAANKYEFGVADPEDVLHSLNPLPDLKEQGVNGFYAYYSKSYNVGAKIKQSSLKTSEYSAYKNSYGKRTLQPQKADVDAYINSIKDENKQFWWLVDSYGRTAPAGNMTNVIGFKAPANGTYTITATCSGGPQASEGVIADDADGVSFSVIKNDNIVWSKNTGKTMHDYDKPLKPLEAKAFEMKKGEEIFFVTDPNASFANDRGHWHIIIDEKIASATKSESKPTKSETKDTDKSKNTTTIKSPESTDKQPQDTNESTISNNQTDSSLKNDIVTGIGDQTNHTGDTSFATNKETEEKKSNATTIIIIIVSIVVVAGGAVGIYLYKTKQKNNDDFSGDNNEN